MENDARAAYAWIDALMAEDDANDPLLDLYQESGEYDKPSQEQHES